MVFTLIRKKSENRQNFISIRDAFNLWESLQGAYLSSERANVWANDAHDKDLKLIIEMFKVVLQDNIKVLEQQMNTYSVPAPDRNRVAVNFPQNSQSVTDEYIAQDLFLCLQEGTENMVKNYRTSVINDSIRTVFKKMIQQKINILNKYVIYLKAKGWVDTPPLYNDVPRNVNEKISTAEIADLWDHLTFRYDNINTSETLRSFAFDGDFRLILTSGIKILTRQVKVLERELEFFGVNLPKRPAKITIQPKDTEIFHDDHMFRTLLIGIQGAITFHIHPIKECSFNDRIRDIFVDLLLSEMEILDQMYKFGKAKGWLSEPVMYGKG